MSGPTLQQKSQMNRAALHRVTIHESGHLVVAHALGLPCGGAAIRPDLSGISFTGPGPVADKIAVCFAGIEAEILAFGAVAAAEVSGDLRQVERIERRHGIRAYHARD